MEELFLTLASLVGVSALFGVLINIGKRFGIVNDGTSGAWNLGLNLVGLILIYANGVFGYGFDLENIDGFAKAVAEIGTAALSLVAMLGSTRAANGAVRGIPIVGHSHSK